ncbi:MAG: hypothetical protein M0C28_32140 [Candidatus Moduliflexus flocculans]|nr:hypothetical protein [Candidatus Moduliflexus flocculans]
MSEPCARTVSDPARSSNRSTPSRPNIRPRPTTCTRPITAPKTTSASHGSKKVMVLGSGAYSIGSSVEFDWCCVNAVQTAEAARLRNHHGQLQPRDRRARTTTSATGSTSTSSASSGFSIFMNANTPAAIILSMGGQIPNNLALKLSQGRACASSELRPNPSTRPKTGTSSPNSWTNSASTSPPGRNSGASGEAEAFAADGRLSRSRPAVTTSLSGAAMSVVFDEKDLQVYLQKAVPRSRPAYPVVICKFIRKAKEIEFDAVARHGAIVCLRPSSSMSKTPASIRATRPWSCLPKEPTSPRCGK